MSEKHVRTKQYFIICILFFVLVWFSGCESSSGPLGIRIGGTSDIFAAYGADKVRIVGLTNFSQDKDAPDQMTLVAYVDLLDEVDSRVKSPGTFRFELYDYIPRSNEPKGRRLYIWSDIDIVDPKKNNVYWQDFLRTYKFELELDFRPASNQQFIFETTFITPRGKRLTNTAQIEYKP